MIKYTDSYIQTIARGLLEPHEQLLHTAAAQKAPFIKLGPWLTHHYLILATSHRMILVDHRQGLLYARMDHVESFSWDQIEELKVAGLFKKQLVFNVGSRKMKLALTKFFGPLKRNLTSAKAIVAQHAQQKQAPQLPSQQLAYLAA
jgi:Bacterial PH domain